jgi:DNA polymerase (family 10)
METIDALNDEMKGIRILKSIEVDILGDGTLDLPDEVLCALDLRICAIHSQLNLSEDQQTERILRAMDNPYNTRPWGQIVDLLDR